MWLLQKDKEHRKALARVKAVRGLMKEMKAVINFDQPTNLDLINCHPRARVVLVEKESGIGLSVVEDDGSIQEIVAPAPQKIERYDPDYPGNPNSLVVMVTTLDGRQGYASLDKAMGYGLFICPDHYHQLVLVMSGPETNRVVESTSVTRRPGDVLVKHYR